MASQVMSARDIPLEEQHKFLDFAKQYEWETVKRLVNEKPAIVSVQPSMRWSALHQAAHSGSADAVCFLLGHHAAADAKTAKGETPLEVAREAHVRAILSDFESSGRVPTPLRTKHATCKLDKAKKAMKGMKTKVTSKIAKGKRGKALVYKGQFVKTCGGLTKDHLTKNKNGKIVSKRMQANGKKSYTNIKKWVEAFVEARAAMSLSGFVPLKKGSDLYAKTMEVYRS